MGTICAQSYANIMTANLKAKHIYPYINPLQPSVDFIYPLKTSGGIEKQHQAAIG